MRFIRPSDPIENASANTTGPANRQLGGSGDDDGGYLVDANGNALQPYSLSWRFLGVFIDIDNCNSNDRRNLNGDSNYSCRKVLWAAYHDPGYQGEGIAEYQFYQRDGSWDGSTCRARTHGLYWPFARCRRLDCHEAKTKLELVGVFKETDGLYDFTEQLFKHQGYCLWDEDKNDDGSRDSGDSADGDSSESSDYSFMTNLAENWVDGCTQFEGATDANGNDLYYDTKPLPGGDMTYGVYTDDACIDESSMTWSDVLASDYNDDDDEIPSIASLNRWNALLSDYKICQPCRAYNRVQTREGGSHSSGGSRSEDSSGDYEDGDDGEGGKDRWGFNCYDDAGYQNCNQCYKFQTQTDMEPASTDDLERATEQGTILAIKVDGRRYGRGHFVAPGRGLRAVKKASTLLLSTMILVGLFYYYYGKHIQRVSVGDDHLEDNLNGNSQRKNYQNDNDEPDWICYIKTAHYRISSRASSLRDRLRSLMPHSLCDQLRALIPFTEATARSAAPPSHADCTKNFLVAQLKQKDAKLAQQEQLIQQLKRTLTYYESRENSCTSAIPMGEMERKVVDSLNKMDQEPGELPEDSHEEHSPSMQPMNGDEFKYSWDGKSVE